MDQYRPKAYNKLANVAKMFTAVDIIILMQLFRKEQEAG